MKISIILLTPGSRRAEMLTEAVRSIMAQTYPDWELLVVSEDPLIRTLFAKENLEDPRICHVEIPDGLGLKVLAVGRNEGLREATGEIVCFLDDDNTFHPERLEASARRFEENPKLEACFSQVAFVSKGATLQVLPKDDIWREEDLRERNIFDIGSLCIRAETLRRIGWFDERLEGAEDWDLVRRIFEGNVERDYIPRSLYYYRIHDGSLSAEFYGEKYQGTRERTYRYLEGKKKPRVKIMVPPKEGNEKYAFTQGYIWEQIERTIRDLGYADFDVSDAREHDVLLCLAPFQFSGFDLDRLLAPYAKARKAAIFMEDPWVFEVNKKIIRKFNYVFTNEQACMIGYWEEGHPRVSILPTSSAAPEHSRPANGETTYDLVMCGFPYQSRVREAQKIVEILHGKARVGIFGYNWPKIQGGIMGGLVDPSELGVLYAKSKMVLVNYCAWSDRGRPEMEKRFILSTPTRGFIEASSPALPIISCKRDDVLRYFGDEAVYYKSPEQAADFVLKFMKEEEERKTKVEKMNEIAKAFTYRERMINMMNIINSDLKKGDIL